MSSKPAQEYDNLESIHSRSTQNIHKAKPHKYSKTIRPVRSMHHMECVCELTGIVSLIDIPRIHGYVLSYIHPISILENSRGIAQMGVGYLRTLDVQVLSGILITLADDYSLFRYAPTYNGAQKNALLRTVSKDILIDAILFIEERTNSNNARFFPSLSFLLDDDTLNVQNAMQARVSEWLKTCSERYYKPHADAAQDREEAPVKVFFASNKKIAQQNKEHSSIRRDFKKWAKITKEHITTLYKAQKISAKLKNFLILLMNEENLKSADAGMVDLIIQKLMQTEIEVAEQIGLALSDHRDKLLSIDEGNDWDEEESFSTMPVGTYVSSEPTIAEEEPAVISPTIYSAPKAEETKPMTFLERIKFLKAQNAAIAKPSTSQDNEPTKGDEDATF